MIQESEEVQCLEELQDFYPFDVFYEEGNYSDKAKQEISQIKKQLKTLGCTDSLIDESIIIILEGNSIVYNEYCKFIENGCEYKEEKPFLKDHVKLPNAKVYTSNKAFRYDLYTIGQLECNYDKFDNKDFLYANTIDDIILSNGVDDITITKRTITGGLNKMCTLNIPTIRKEKLQGNKTVYIMNDGNKESYLSVPRDQALELAFLGDTVTKLLVIFNACLYNHIEPRRISQEYMLESLGLSISGQNRKKVATAVDILYKLGYINKYEEQNPHIPTDICYSYTLNTYEQWKEKSKPISINRKGKQ